MRLELEGSSSCEAGWFARNSGFSVCSRCPAGTFSSSAGATSCVNCPSGHSSTIGSSSCFECTANHFAGSGDPSCEPCPAMHFAQPASASCSPCPSVSASDVNPLCYKKLQFTSCWQTTTYGTGYECHQAYDGIRPHDVNNPSAKCAITKVEHSAEWRGYFDVPVSLNQILLLNHNSVQSTNVRVDVYDGKVWRNCDTVTSMYEHKVLHCRVDNVEILRIKRLSAEHLNMCEIEVYGLVAKDTTSSCPAGQVQKQSGSATCSDCSPGTYSSASGATSCQLCPAGQYSSSPGATSCAACSAAYYSSEGSSACLKCPSGTFSHAGAATCTQCPPFDPLNLHTGCYARVHFSSCSQSSLNWDNPTVACGKAMDSSRSPNAYPDCSMTKNNWHQWWQGRFYTATPINYVVFFGRLDVHSSESTDLNVHADNHFCGTITGVRTFTIMPCNVHNAHTVKLTHQHANYLTTCEVEVYRNL